MLAGDTDIIPDPWLGLENEHNSEVLCFQDKVVQVDPESGLTSQVKEGQRLFTLTFVVV